MSSWDDPRAEADRDYRAKWGRAGKPFGRPLRSAYYPDLRPAPMGPNVTRADAKHYVAEIIRVRELGHTEDGVSRYTRTEQENLRRLLRKWERRARGEDPRFNAMGNVGGVNNRWRPRTKLDDLRDLGTRIRGTVTPATEPIGIIGLRREPRASDPRLGG